MRGLIVFFCLISLFCDAAERLQALFACDTLSDTKTSTQRDVSHLKKALQSVAKQTGLSLRLDTVNGDKLTLSHLYKRIKSYTGRVVFFYYSGHGYRTNTMSSQWPLLYLPARQETVSTQKIISRLQSLNARLIIIVLDCCNNLATLSPNKVLQSNFKALTHTSDRNLQASKTFACHRHLLHKPLPGLKTLFLASHGQIIASGSSPGSFSFADKSGSIFTSSFISALSEQCLTEQTSWQIVLEHTVTKCLPIQHPIYSIHLSNSH